MIAPPAKGLFHRAISESGGVISHSVAEADIISRHVLDLLLVQDGRARKLEEAEKMARAMQPLAIRAYMRSKSDQVNVNAIAAQFGGGGHSAAAGARIPGKPLSVQRKVLAAIKKALNTAR